MSTVIYDRENDRDASYTVLYRQRFKFEKLAQD